MKYVGSKSAISKRIVPIIQSFISTDTEGYMEPFVGGANVIDKIQADVRIGYDVHKELIALLRYAQDPDSILPGSITEQEYVNVRDNRDTYTDWYVGLVGFCATFGAKYYGGYARAYKSDGITLRDMPGEGIRNLERQRAGLCGVTFDCKSFRDIDLDALKGWVIYCDPPYSGVTGYSGTEFNKSEFVSWCLRAAVNNTVLVSEYEMPDGFECIWQGEHRTQLRRHEHLGRTERLYKVNG